MALLPSELSRLLGVFCVLALLELLNLLGVVCVLVGVRYEGGGGGGEEVRVVDLILPLLLLLLLPLLPPLLPPPASCEALTLATLPRILP